MTRAAAPWLLLAILCPALTSQTDARHEAPTTGPPAPPKTTPIRNLRLNPSQRRLTWELDDGDVITYGSRFLCQKGRGPPLRADPSGRSCSFPSLSHCHVTELSAFPERYKDLAASVWFPEPHHDHSMAARDLHCWVHDVDHMTCRWGRGQGATDDVRYRMFWRDARLGPDRDHECLHYDVTSYGARVGCNLDLATIDPDPTSLMTVTVNGSARTLGVACNDEVVDLGHVEILAPPTLMAECNSSEAHVRWAARSRFHSGFQFTLQINKVIRSSHQEPQNQMLFGTEFRIVNPGTTLSIRVRAHTVDGRKVSAWSPTQSLACDLQANPATLMWLTLAGAGLTAMVATSLLLLWRRKPLLARLFPPIPRMQVQLEAHRDVVAWAPVPEDCEITHVTDA